MKNQNLKIRLSEEEKEAILKICREGKINISEYMRAILKQNKDKEIKIISKDEIEIFEKIYNEISMIGNNLNQISYYFNLQHMKLYDKNLTSLEDFLMLDKVKKNELLNLKNSLNDLKEEIELLKKEKINYDKKNEI